jgi:transcriptional regulator GlxA family with amidase domain
MRIAVLVLDDVFDTGLATILDTFDTANALDAEPGRSPRFVVDTVGVRRRARTHQGLSMSLAAISSAARPDIVIVPALGAKTAAGLAEMLGRRDVREAGTHLRRWAASGVVVAAACTATFVLAHAALLDGRTATTTWWLVTLFRERFPHVDLDESRMVVASGSVVTAGAALAHLDLALWLVRRASPALARTTARHLVFDVAPSQAPYLMPDHLAHADPVVEKFERWARRHLAEFSIGRAAQSVGTSERTLERRLRSALGKSPIAYVQDLRVEQAVHSLQTSDASLDEIAAQVGYGDAVTLRTLLRRKTGQSLRALRTPGDSAARRPTRGGGAPGKRA